MTSTQITITEISDSRIAIASPYAPEFVAGIKRLGGRWDPDGKVWIINSSERKEVEALLADVYGWMPPHVAEMVGTQTIVITARHNIVARRDGIRVAGQTIARAHGRDSGARLGPGVVQVAGKDPLSGGSMKNWETIIPEGTRFRLTLPMGVEPDGRDWAVEYL